MMFSPSPEHKNEAKIEVKNKGQFSLVPFCSTVRKLPSETCHQDLSSAI